jgi:hypothetical protein
MHWHIIRTLFWKEVQRQLANRGGLALAALLVVAALLLSLSRNEDGPGKGLLGGIETCFIDYWRDDGWVQHLRQNVPAELARHVQFRDLNQLATGRLVYPPASGAIQMRLIKGDDGRVRRRICVWQASTGDLAPYEVWFWRESARYFQRHAAMSPLSLFSGEADSSFAIEHEHAILDGGVDMRSSITAAWSCSPCFLAVCI